MRHRRGRSRSESAHCQYTAATRTRRETGRSFPSSPAQMYIIWRLVLPRTTQERPRSHPRHGETRVCMIHRAGVIRRITVSVPNSSPDFRPAGSSKSRGADADFGSARPRSGGAAIACKSRSLPDMGTTNSALGCLVMRWVYDFMAPVLFGTG